MEKSETTRLADAIETGLRDGRTLEALRKAMKGSGYDDDDIREVIAHVDRKNIVRKPRQKKKKEYPNYKTIAGLVVLVVMTMLIFFSGGGPTLPGPGEIAPPAANNTADKPIKCYVVNESVKQDMIGAGAECDMWFFTNNTVVKPETRCYVVNESIKQSMIDAGTQCDKWFVIDITEI